MIQTLGLTATTRLAAGANLAVRCGRSRRATSPGSAGLRRSPCACLPYAPGTAPPTAGDDPDAASAGRALRLALPAVAFFSGLAGLACEGLWARYLAFFSNYAYGFTNLLGAYLLGLGGGRPALPRGPVAACAAASGCWPPSSCSSGWPSSCASRSAPCSTRARAYDARAPGLRHGADHRAAAGPADGHRVPPAVRGLRPGRGHGGAQRRAALRARTRPAPSSARWLPVFISIPLLGRAGQHRPVRAAVWGARRSAADAGRPPGRRQARPGGQRAGPACWRWRRWLAVPHDVCTRVFLGTSPCRWAAIQEVDLLEARGARPRPSSCATRSTASSEIYINEAAEVPTTYPDMVVLQAAGQPGPAARRPDPRACAGGRLRRRHRRRHGGPLPAGQVGARGRAGALGDRGRPTAGEARTTAPSTDPKVSIAIEDGRNYLLNAWERWPVIVCDSTHPKAPTVGSSTPRSSTAPCASGWAPDGVFVQWLPDHGLTTAEYRIIVRTFQSVFPHTSLWVALRHRRARAWRYITRCW